MVPASCTGGNYWEFELLHHSSHATSGSTSTLSFLHTQLQPCQTELFCSYVCLCVRLSVHTSVSLPTFLSLATSQSVCLAVSLFVSLSVEVNPVAPACLQLRLSFSTRSHVSVRPCIDENATFGTPVFMTHLAVLPTGCLHSQG